MPSLVRTGARAVGTLADDPTGALLDLALVFSLALTPAFIRLFRKLEFGQFIRDDGPQSHHVKRGTPTMGGIVFILATLFGVFTAGLLNGGEGITPSSLLVLLMLVGMGAVGFVDDFLKVRNQRSLGLGGWSKVAGQLVASLVDPHGTHLADAVGKLKGLAAYAATHLDAYHRIQSVALVNDDYLLLNHKDPLIRDAIATFEGTDSRELFRAHGTRY